MYDPTIARWTSQDPLGFTAGDVNLYRYVGNDPTNLPDPSGLQAPPPSMERLQTALQERKDQLNRLSQEYEKVADDVSKLAHERDQLLEQITGAIENITEDLVNPGQFVNELGNYLQQIGNFPNYAQRINDLQAQIDKKGRQTGQLEQSIILEQKRIRQLENEIRLRGGKPGG